MTFQSPALSSGILGLAAVAAVGLGWLGGLAAHPVMKPPQGSDRRERYRPVAAGPVDDDGPDFGGSYGYGYNYNWGSWLLHPGAGRSAEAGAHEWPDEAGPATAELPAADEAPIDAAGTPDKPLELSDGPAVVADALERTAGIGGEVAAPDQRTATTADAAGPDEDSADATAGQDR